VTQPRAAGAIEETPVDRRDAAHDARRSVRGLSDRGAALVCLGDPRVELATMLILQELGLSVDLVADPQAAMRWAKQARYQLIVAGGSPVPLPTLATYLRRAAPDTRIVLLADDWSPTDDLGPLEVEVLGPPVDVNALMRGLWPAD